MIPGLGRGLPGMTGPPRLTNIPFIESFGILTNMVVKTPTKVRQKTLDFLNLQLESFFISEEF
jgi:hypothetical protein